MSQLKCSEDLKRLILETCYPIGHIWVSMNSTNPQNIVGGTWVQIKGRYLCCIDPNTSMAHNTPKKEFGSWSTGDHVLTIEQMPSHHHEYEVYINKEPLGGHDKLLAYGMPQGSLYYVWGSTYQGGNQAHNHKLIPPSIGVYAWYRTA